MAKVYILDSEGIVMREEESFDMEINLVEEIFEGDEVVEYRVSVPMKNKFHKGKFDINTYFLISEHIKEANKEAEANFEAGLVVYERNHAQDIEEWEMADEDSRSDSPPQYQPPTFIPYPEPDYSDLWIETLTPEEIHALLNPQEEESVDDFPNTMIKEINKIKSTMDKFENNIVSSESDQEVIMLALTDIFEQLIILQEK